MPPEERTKAHEYDNKLCKVRLLRQEPCVEHSRAQILGLQPPVLLHSQPTLCQVPRRTQQACKQPSQAAMTTTMLCNRRCRPAGQRRGRQRAATLLASVQQQPQVSLQLPVLQPDATAPSSAALTTISAQPSLGHITDSVALEPDTAATPWRLPAHSTGAVDIWAAPTGLGIGPAAESSEAGWRSMHRNCLTMIKRTSAAAQLLRTTAVGTHCTWLRPRDNRRWSGRLQMPPPRIRLLANHALLTLWACWRRQADQLHMQATDHVADMSRCICSSL